MAHHLPIGCIQLTCMQPSKHCVHLANDTVYHDASLLQPCKVVVLYKAPYGLPAVNANRYLYYLLALCMHA